MSDECTRYLRKPASLEAGEVPGHDGEGLVAKLERRNTQLMAALSQFTLQATALETAVNAILITDSRSRTRPINCSVSLPRSWPAGLAGDR